MADRMHRTQILIEPDQHSALTKIAKKQKKSVSEIIREIVGQYLAERTEDVRWQRRQLILERAQELRKAIQEERNGKRITIDLVDELNEIRQQRDASLHLKDGSNEDRH